MTILILGMMNSSMAQETWFYPNPNKLTVPYSGSRTDGIKVRSLAESLVPNVRVLIDRDSQQITFQAPSKRIEQIRWLLKKAGFLKS